MGAYPGRQIAITSASVTSCAIIAARMDHPAPVARRDRQSRRHTSSLRRSEVCKGGDHLRFAEAASNVRLSTVGVTAFVERTPVSDGISRSMR